MSVHVLCMPYNNNNNYTFFNPECQRMYCVCPTTITRLYSTQDIIQPRVSMHVLCMPYNNNNNYTLFNPECQCMYCVCPTTRTRTILYSTQSVSACTVYALQQEQELYFIQPRVSVHVLCMPYNKNNRLSSTQSVSACTVYALQQ